MVPRHSFIRSTSLPGKIIDILQHQRTLSFEFYPPKTTDALPAVWRAIHRLSAFRPNFVSVTYGAGGSGQTLTEEMVLGIHQAGDVLPMAHLSCVGKSEDELHPLLSRLEAAGVQNIIALRGDAPAGEDRFIPVPGGFDHATGLIQFTRQNFHFGIAAACYPESHVESPDLSSDMDRTKQKLDAGADFLITQLFYDNRYFFDFLDRARKAGITAPILAGVLPILNVAQVRRFTAHCGVRIPPELDRRLDRLDGDDEAVRDLGIEYATQQVQELWQNGVDGIHFYALNRSQSISKILHNLENLDPSHAPEAEGVA